MEKVPSKILGTANFGMPYGLANKHRQISRQMANKIIRLALKEGFAGLDTARAYGNAEERLGENSGPLKSKLIFTKVSEVNGSYDFYAFKEQLNYSIRHLKRRPNVVFFHSKDFLSRFKEIEVSRIEAHLSEHGKKIDLGLSVYSKEEIEFTLDSYPAIRTFQVPLSIINKDTQYEDFLRKLQTHGYSIIARSIFIQGLLLIDNNAYWNKLNKQETETMIELNQYSQETGRSKLDLCISYISLHAPVDGYILGVDSINQLLEISQSSRKARQLDNFILKGKTEGLFDMRESRFQKPPVSN